MGASKALARKFAAAILAQNEDWERQMKRTNEMLELAGKTDQKLIDKAFDTTLALMAAGRVRP